MCDHLMAILLIGCACAQSLRGVWLFVATLTWAHQAPLFMEFSRPRILEWIATSYYRASSQARDQNSISCISCLGQDTSPLVPPGKVVFNWESTSWTFCVQLAFGLLASGPHKINFSHLVGISISVKHVMIFSIAPEDVFVSGFFLLGKELFILFSFYWSIAGLQCCVSFSCTTKWMNNTYTYIPSF